jgi:hypothetical protein
VIACVDFARDHDLRVAVRGGGYSCDNLISVDIVTADGRLLTASEREHEDLFWGMQGGSGNEGRAIWLLRCEPMSVR